jgi:hypothetical protein
MNDACALGVEPGEFHFQPHIETDLAHEGNPAQIEVMEARA